MQNVLSLSHIVDIIGVRYREKYTSRLRGVARRLAPYLHIPALQIRSRTRD